MQLNLIYTKTAKGLEEIQTRIHKLPAPLRRLLIMVDGHSSAADLIGRLTMLGDVQLALEQLAAGGFITVPAIHPVPDSAELPTLPEFNLDQAKSLIYSVLIGAMGPAAEHRIECVKAATAPEQLRTELEVIRDILTKMLSKAQAEQVWQQLEPIMLALDRRASFQSQEPVTRPIRSANKPVADSASDVSALPEQAIFNLDKAKSFIRFTLLGAMGPSAARRIERIEAATTAEHLRLELDAIRDMLPKVLSKRQAEQTWRQLEPIMLSLHTPSPSP